MVTTVSKVKDYLEAIDKDNQNGKEINAILDLNDNILEDAKKVDEKIKSGKAGKLAGMVFVVKSNICVKGLVANCASKTMDNYTCPYDASVIEKIKAEDGIMSKD